METENRKSIFSDRVRPWLISIGIFFILIFFSFQYGIITKGFPTGDDPAIHINTIRITTFSGILKTNYPIPLTIFKLFHSITNLSLPVLFVTTISLFLLFTSCAMFVLVWKGTGSKLTGFIAASVIALGAWTTDGLRMGLLAEVFGWGMLLVTLYFFSKKHFWWTIIFSLLLICSHPFSFIIFVLIFTIYSLIGLFTREDRRFVLSLIAFYCVLVSLAYLVYPPLLQKFFAFSNPEIIGWGERRLWEILTVNDPTRSLVTLFAITGTVVSVRNWHKPFIKISYLLLFVGLFMSMNQVFGIRFLVFRFFPYLEMGLAIFGAIGINYVVKSLAISKRYFQLVVLIVAAIVLYPQFRGDKLITTYQSQVAESNDSMTIGDQDAIRWISSNVQPDVYFAASHKRAIWIKALTDLRNVAVDDTLSKKTNYQYIYYPEITPVPDSLYLRYDVVYNSKGVKIFKVK